MPLVVRMPQGAGHQLGPTHSHSFEALFLHVPGLLVAVPSTPADAKGLLKAAIRDDNPVVFIEHEYLYGQRGEVPEDDDHLVDFGEAAIRREGTDVTIVGISRMAVDRRRRPPSVLAEEHGVEAEVIDPRTLRPLDLDTILASVRKTNRCVIVEEGWPHGGVGANLAALVQEQAFDDLDAPVGRVTGADVPMPYAKNLEQIAFPHEPQVVAGRARDVPRRLNPDPACDQPALLDDEPASSRRARRPVGGAADRPRCARAARCRRRRRARRRPLSPGTCAPIHSRMSTARNSDPARSNDAAWRANSRRVTSRCAVSAGSIVLSVASGVRPASAPALNAWRDRPMTAVCPAHRAPTLPCCSASAPRGSSS